MTSWLAMAPQIRPPGGTPLLPPHVRAATDVPVVADSHPRFVLENKNNRNRVQGAQARARDAAIARNLDRRAA